MRIIAGEAGGRRLESPEGRQIRPTPERVREALFNILGDIDQAVVVDGFAGSGALGCEALSRGADCCYFIDPSEEAVELIEENLRRVDAHARGIILHGSFASQLAFVGDRPDLVLLDPPYESGLGDEALVAMSQAGCITEGALVVLEQEKSEPIPDIDGFDCEDWRVYGRTRISFFRRK